MLYRLATAIRHHTVNEIILFVVVWFLLAYYDLRLKVLPYSWNRRLIMPGKLSNTDGRHDADPSPGTERTKRMEILSRTAARAASHPLWFDMSCLRRALALRAILRLSGIRADLVYGAQKITGSHGWRLHAWLEADGYVVDTGAPSVSYRPFQ